MFYIYITKNKDWIDKYKYGYTKNIEYRLYNSHEQHSFLSKYKLIWSFTINKKIYKLPYKKPDEILSLLCRDIDKINKVNKIYNYNFEYLKELNKYLINDGGGREFIIKDGLNIIKNIINIEFPILGITLIKEYSIEEINDINLNYKNKIKSINNKYDKFFNNITTELYEYQKECLEKSNESYKIIDKLILNWPCGLGKTKMSLHISVKYFINYLLIGVSSLQLLHQWIDEIKQIYFNIPILTISSSSTSSETNIYNTTNNTNIIKWFKKNNKGIVLTLYQSSNKLYSAIKKDITFDFAILDECHHLCKTIDNNSINSYTNILNLNIIKMLSLTATMKALKNKSKIDNYDRDIFGDILDEKSIKWAIDNKKITDYNILTANMTNEDLNEIMIENNIKVDNLELFLSACICLKSIKEFDDFTHTLIYTNSIENSKIVETFINILIDKDVFKIRGYIYNKSLNSNSDSNISNELKNFINSDYGIISCVYLFGEGFNLPELSGVIYSENMESSIRIVQYGLRPNRLNYKKPNKKAYLIIPFIEDDINNLIIQKSFIKINRIIKKMRNIDENIENKILAPIYNKSKSKIQLLKDNQDDEDIIINNNDELCNKIKLILRDSKALDNNGINDDKFEYIKCRLLNKDLKIKNMDDYCSKLINHPFYKENPELYFKSNGTWINHYDFFNINICIYPIDKNMWNIKCKKLNINTIEKYKELCKIHEDLPLYPEILYKDFTTFAIELQTNKRRV